MTQNEELIFGLKRWIKKGINYVGNYSLDEFIHDELRFDATCFCTEILRNILRKIKDSNELKDKYTATNFDDLYEKFEKLFYKDAIDYQTMYEIFKEEGSIILFNLTINEF